MRREASGFTLIEALISTVIMSIVSFAFMSVLLVNYKTNAKLDSMHDTINAVRAIKERIAKDVREGRSLGDVYGTDNYDSSADMHYVTGSNKFPASNDPLWSGGIPIPSGWSATNNKFTLSNTCLIVQIPVLDDHADNNGKHYRSTTASGWPTQIPAANVSTPPQDNVETHVYQVVADPTAGHSGEYRLEFCSYAGAGSGSTGFTGYDPAAHNTITASGQKAEVLVSGIIGPLDSNNVPKVFQFINPKASNVPVDNISNAADNIAEYTGVVCNLEIKRHQSMAATRKDISVNPIGMKLEVFLRNNALATSVGQPAAYWGQ
jgi:type II secretory pathway pseudopilin PulG